LFAAKQMDLKAVRLLFRFPLRIDAPDVRL
jgi:hypothetical protein